MTFEPGPVRPAEPPEPHLPPTGPPPPPPASPYEKSEATRLLCAGVYLDPDYRRRVIAELVEHDERSAPRPWASTCSPSSRTPCGPGRWRSAPARCSPSPGSVRHDEDNTPRTKARGGVSTAR